MSYIHRTLTLLLLLFIQSLAFGQQGFVELEFADKSKADCWKQVEIREGNKCDPNKKLEGHACDRIISDEFLLSEQGKSFFGDFCLNLRDKVTFINSAGAIKTFIVTSKNLAKSAINYTSPNRCPKDTSQFIKNCIYQEEMSMKWESVDREILLSIELEMNRPYGKIAVEGKYEALSINRHTRRSLWHPQFKLVTHPGDQENIDRSFEVFHKEIKLGCNVYQNVYSNENKPGHTIVWGKMYLNSTGLIAFMTDEYRVLWVRQ